MANQSIGSIKDLSSSRTEALQALFSSLRDATIGDGSSASGLSQDRLKQLSDQLGEMLGDEPLQRNEQGQLLNGDGDPIIEISEPVSETPEASAYLHEPDLVPIHSLSPAERERRRRERDRILDILEEEERLLQFKERREKEEKRKEDMRRRMEEAKSESEQLLQAKMLQKKMGKALLEAVGKAGESKASENTTMQKSSKKKVTFSEPVILEPTASANEEVTSSGQADWGDIVLGRLRSSPRVPLVSTASADKYPMKVQVVERRRPNASTPTTENVADSDDESPISPLEDNETLGGEEDHILSRQDADSAEGETPAEPQYEDFDFDSAQHQREVAFEYFTKRHAIGHEAARAMESRHNSGDETKYPHFPPQDTQKPTVTRFRADRMASAYDKSCPQQPWTSLGSSTVPEARQKSIRNAIRFGKLENDQLLGGPSGESGSDDDEMREISELLKRGAIQNVGPDFHPASLPSRHSSRDPSISVVAANQQSSKFETSQGDMMAETNLPRHTRTPPKSVISSVVERRPPLSNLQK